MSEQCCSRSAKLNKQDEQHKMQRKCFPQQQKPPPASLCDQTRPDCRLQAKDMLHTVLRARGQGAIRGCSGEVPFPREVYLDTAHVWSQMCSRDFSIRTPVEQGILVAPIDFSRFVATLCLLPCAVEMCIRSSTYC